MNVLVFYGFFPCQFFAIISNFVCGQKARFLLRMFGGTPYQIAFKIFQKNVLKKFLTVFLKSKIFKNLQMSTKRMVYVLITQTVANKH